MLKDYPIKNDSRYDLVHYLCDLHNIVNKRLGKPHFDCNKAFEFWGGDCGCDKDKGKDVDKSNDKKEEKVTSN